MIRTIGSRLEIIRNGVVIGQLAHADPPTVSMSADAEIPMTLRCKVSAHDGINVLSDMIRPVCILDGVDRPLGDYMIGTLTSGKVSGREVWDIEAYDQCLRLKQTSVETRYFIAAGTWYISAISALLQAAGIRRVLTSSCSDTIATDREDWEIGENYLTIVNDLLAEIAFDPLWFDRDGFARLQKSRAPSAGGIDITYAADSMSILHPETSSQLDVFDAPNVFIAIVSNPEIDAMTATAEIDTPMSALSTVRRGRRIVEVTRIDNIASQEALQAYVDARRNAGMLSTEVCQFSTGVNPVHDVGNVIGLHHPDLDGVFKEISWSLSIEAGAKMTHSVRRVHVA